jgi:ketosteroid isomerase-like protein
VSQENAEVVRRVIDYLNETGEAGPLELYDEEITFTTRGDGPGGGETFSGHRGMAAAVAMFGEVWAETAARIIELIDGDDVVVAVFRIELRSHAGVELVVEEAWAYWLRDGKLTRIEQHGNRQQALEAAGLQT